MFLHPLNLDGWADKAWCVPSAVAMLSGASVAHMHSRAAFLQEKSINKVKGMFLDEAILLLREQGFKVRRINMPERFPNKPPTIQKFLENRTPEEFMSRILLSVSSSGNEHVLCAHMGFAGDNWTKHPVPIEKFPKLRRKVYEAFIVSEDHTV